MTEQIAKTESLCPHCLRRIPARRIVENGTVYLEKSCPEHGNLEKVLLWKNDPKPYNIWTRRRIGDPVGSPADFRIYDTGSFSIAPAGFDGCPFDCGICPNHKQETCSIILEVTDRCNIRCPICFAASEAKPSRDPDLIKIGQILQAIQDRASPCPIQLSGGEPTVRNDLPRIVELARSMGFDHVQINTNGIRLAQEADYGQALKDAGVTDFFLQFDGLSNDVYRSIRGAELLQLKFRAIERCKELRIGVILVPTLVKNINENQMGAIIQFAKKWIPVVKGVHFQPMTFLGRYPGPPNNQNRILIPDILTAIEEQTAGELKVDNFIPPG